VSVEMIQCPCIYPDWDGVEDPDEGIYRCACGHVFDEHDEDGQCQAEIEASP
jgi:acetone carboxylase gamma subunit